MQTRCKKARLKHTGTDTLTTTAVVVDHVQVAVFVSRESVQYWMRERRVRVNVDGERAHADSLVSVGQQCDSLNCRGGSYES